jgi:hypothetical protein
MAKMLGNWVGVVTGDVSVTPKPQEPPEPRSKASRKKYEYESMGTLWDFLALKQLFEQIPKTKAIAASLALHHQKHSNVPQILARGDTWLARKKAQKARKKAREEK